MTRSAPSGVNRILQRVSRTVYDHLVAPFLQTHDPLPAVAWGATIGMFVGLTPTVGVQMYIVTAIWVVCRYLFRFRFNLTIGVAMVWITNPITTIPFYYLFLRTGDLFLELLGYGSAPMSFAEFRAEVLELAAGQPMGWLEWLMYSTEVLVVEYGWPLLVGSLIFAIPGSVLSYPATMVFLGRYRRYLARQQGLSYEAWRERYESKR
jgi:uncharacterized protein